jgi:TetR/AcrR family transcriptional repressor of mexJK operon
MSTELPRKAVREGQTHKRESILVAARELFVQSGVDRTSMDAVAARASVSKRTVYDYYGDKHRLLIGVIEDAGESALATLREATAQYLSDGVAIGSAVALEQALSDFAEAIGASMLTSSNYVAAVKLIAENAAMLPELDNHPLDIAHAEVLSERMEHFAGRGLLEADDPRLAAEHFTALTTLRILNEPASKRAQPEHVRRMMMNGVQAFMRAYGTRTNAVLSAGG